MDSTISSVIGIAAGLVVVVILIFIRGRLNPNLQSEVPKYQPRSFDEIIHHDPSLKRFVMEAKQDGATHIADDGRIFFYRIRKENYERRSLEYMPSGYWFWYSDWRKCKKLPEHALTIPDTF